MAITRCASASVAPKLDWFRNLNASAFEISAGGGGGGGGGVDVSLPDEPPQPASSKARIRIGDAIRGMLFRFDNDPPEYYSTLAGYC